MITAESASLNKEVIQTLKRELEDHWVHRAVSCFNNAVVTMDGIIVMLRELENRTDETMTPTETIRMASDLYRFLDGWEAKKKDDFLNFSSSVEQLDICFWKLLTFMPESRRVFILKEWRRATISDSHRP